MDRKDLLLEERDKRTLEDKEKIDKTINQGGALRNMTDTFGWKLLYKEFLQPQLTESRFLNATKEDLADIRAEIRILRQLMQFIESRIEAAEKLAVKIKK